MVEISKDTLTEVSQLRDTIPFVTINLVIKAHVSFLLLALTIGNTDANTKLAKLPARHSMGLRKKQHHANKCSMHAL